MEWTYITHEGGVGKGFGHAGKAMAEGDDEEEDDLLPGDLCLYKGKSVQE